MNTIRSSGLSLDCVVESSGPTYPVPVLLPDLDPSLIERERHWLEPAYHDVQSGQLVLSFHSFLLRSERHTILVDACVGNDKERPGFPEWHRQKFPYLERLQRLGVAPEAVDFVCCTHLHPDHVGWNTRLEDGRWVPTFANATYLFARTEWTHWQTYANAKPDPTDPTPEPVRRVLRDCYRDSVHPVVEAGRAQLIDDGHEIEAGIWVEAAPGHTPGNAVLRVERDGLSAVLSGDVMHHPLQILYPEVSSAFCNDPDLSRRTRKAFLESHAETGRVILPAHFPDPTACRIECDGGAFVFTPWSPGDR